MNTVLLVVAVLVIPLLWGYLAELLTRRLWPESAESSPESRPNSKADRNRHQDYFDFQI